MTSSAWSSKGTTAKAVKRAALSTAGLTKGSFLESGTIYGWFVLTTYRLRSAFGTANGQLVILATFTLSSGNVQHAFDAFSGRINHAKCHPAIAQFAQGFRRRTNYVFDVARFG